MRNMSSVCFEGADHETPPPGYGKCLRKLSSLRQPPTAGERHEAWTSPAGTKDTLDYAVKTTVPPYRSIGIDADRECSLIRNAAA